ncbi:MAG: methionyl-tRNA formyltransferase [Candidatus Nealsonbacteria bacterium]
MNNNKNIIFISCVEYGFDILKVILEKDYKIKAIISLNQNQAEKYNISGYKSFEKISQDYKIPIYYPHDYSLKNKQDLEEIKNLNPDLFLVFGWQRLIPEEILKLPFLGTIGAHGSNWKLPKGKGRSPVNWSLIENRKKFIIHIFYFDLEIDSGDIIDFFEFEINLFDTVRTIYQKISILIGRMLIKNFDLILTKQSFCTPQQGKSTFYPKRKPEDGLINWNKSSMEIYNFIRALTKPYPGSFTFLNNKKIFIWKAQPFDSKIKFLNKKPGSILELFSNGDFLVKTKDSSLLITNFKGILINKIKKGDCLL